MLLEFTNGLEKLVLLLGSTDQLLDAVVDPGEPELTDVAVHQRWQPRVLIDLLGAPVAVVDHLVDVYWPVRGLRFVCRLHLVNSDSEYFLKEPIPVRRLILGYASLFIAFQAEIVLAAQQPSIVLAHLLLLLVVFHRLELT